MFESGSSEIDTLGECNTVQLVDLIAVVPDVRCMNRTTRDGCAGISHSGQSAGGRFGITEWVECCPSGQDDIETVGERRHCKHLFEFGQLQPERYPAVAVRCR